MAIFRLFPYGNHLRMPRFRRLVTRQYTIRVVLVTLALLICGYKFRYSLENFAFKNYCAQPITKTANDAKNFGECRLPTIDPFSSDAMALVKNVEKPLRCKTVKRATLSGGKLNIFGTDVLSASYQSVHRPDGDDFTWKLGQPVAIEGKTATVSDEFIELTLKLANDDVLKEYLLQVMPRPEITQRQASKTELGLNVLIFAMDSVSNGHAQRKLPKSYAYIRDVLQGHVFMGHSAVGDGTTEQLAAMLSGKGEREQPESRRGMPGAQVVDSWDWVFKKAKEQGYITSYVEDIPQVGAFNYRLLGFKDPPADYYPRAFLLAAQNRRDLDYRHCYGSEKAHGYQFDLATKIFEQYPDKSKFLFHFTDVTHSDFNAAEYFENDLLSFMKDFKNKGYLKNTLLIVMGDHGWRYGDFRQTVQGKLEERLPFFTMTFPEWFREKYPTLEKNLKTNTQRLTSWYDVHPTLKHILTYPNEPENVVNGKSLLTAMPAVRSCKDAHIPSHWCPCLQWTAVDKLHNHIEHAVSEAIRYMNDLNMREPLAAKQCAALTLGQVKHSEVETPSNEVLSFYQSLNGKYVNYEGPGTKNKCNYQITFQTVPNNGIFETSVTYSEGEFHVKGEISRIDAYGDQPKCIASLLPHLRKYCFCT